MYGAGNPQMAALGALGALGGTLRELAMSPVRRWGQTGVIHKVIAAASGAGLAYYLHKKGMADVAVAAIGVGGAYAASALMHYPQVAREGTNGAALPGAQPIAGALPAAQVQNMAAQAQTVMNSTGLQGAALAPAGAAGAQPQPAVIGAQPQPVAPAVPQGSSKWAALG